MQTHAGKWARAGARRTWAAALVVVGCLFAHDARADNAQDAALAKIKSAYVLNFLRFAQWPDDAFAGPASPIRLCVLGRDKLGPYLDSTVRGSRVHSRAVAVERVTLPTDSAEPHALAYLRECHLLYISDSERSHLAPVLASVQGSSTLTVGETGVFARNGTMLALNFEGDRVIFYANPAAVRAGRVDLSSKVLQLARVVAVPEHAANE